MKVKYNDTVFKYDNSSMRWYMKKHQNVAQGLRDLPWLLPSTVCPLKTSHLCQCCHSWQRNGYKHHQYRYMDKRGVSAKVFWRIKPSKLTLSTNQSSLVWNRDSFRELICAWNVVFWEFTAFEWGFNSFLFKNPGKLSKNMPYWFGSDKCTIKQAFKVIRTE